MHERPPAADRSPSSYRSRPKPSKNCGEVPFSTKSRPTICVLREPRLGLPIGQHASRNVQLICRLHCGQPLGFCTAASSGHALLHLVQCFWLKVLFRAQTKAHTFHPRRMDAAPDTRLVICCLCGLCQERKRSTRRSPRPGDADANDCAAMERCSETCPLYNSSKPVTGRPPRKHQRWKEVPLYNSYLASTP